MLHTETGVYSALVISYTYLQWFMCNTDLGYPKPNTTLIITTYIYVQIHKMKVPHLTIIQRMAIGDPSNMCFINMFTYLLKLMHIQQSYSTMNTKH